MDCSVVRSRHGEFYQVSTTDFFYPSVDDPYMEGKIACANVLSDLYAMGITEVDNILMILGVSRQMTPHQQKIVTSSLIRGFNDQAKLAKTSVTGGQTVQNPWPMCGGVAMSLCTKAEIILPENAVVGDVLVLTKPLGTQVISNVHQWSAKPTEGSWGRIVEKRVDITLEEAHTSYIHAMLSMARLNRTAAELMHSHEAHACTDVTGFGLLGHARNLAHNQKAEVDFEILTLPIINKMYEVGEEFTGFRLSQGLSAETSGGLLICMPAHMAQPYINQLRQKDNDWPAWVIGRVVPAATPGERTARLVDNPTILPVHFHLEH
eukprot:gnl/Hemi2/912_TR325_c0_g1_i1.p1 gnl/Hemi2/912_TR325_c0_g1~~gnl/Hemi2/912_TR325_c0_g1_i1.p1  ORF type:complete len:321 (-),score=61.80 gnl/Hemi2/912_TR325_c0_g1_i1:63-1025(-)